MSDYIVIDGFLDQPLLDALLDHALRQEHALRPTGLGPKAVETVRRQYRLSDYCEAGLGPLEQPFVERIHARFDDIAGQLGIRPFPIARSEVELIAHGDGAMYVAHTDAYTHQQRELETTDRIVSMVFYFHRQPKAFTGGEIAVHPMGRGEPRVLEPANNRLVAFPSFALHEVRKVSCPSGKFADSRFAVNCWLHRAQRKVARREVQ